MKQPKIKIPKTRFEIAFDAIGIIFYILIISYLATHYNALPDRVPSHFNALGEADSFGSKQILLILPAISGGLWVLMTVMEKSPHAFNYLNLREDNIEAQYKNGRMMVNVLKNEIVLLFGAITYLTVQIATGVAAGLGELFLPIYLVVILGSMFVFMWRMLKM